MRVSLSSVTNLDFPLSWNDILCREGLWEAYGGEIVVMPRVEGSSYGVIRNNRLDISGSPVGEPHPAREGTTYRKYKGIISLSND